MRITGHMLIGQSSVSGTAGAFKAFSPALAADIEPAFGGAGPADVDQACRLAASSFARYRETTPETRASFLEAIATGIEGLGDALIERAMAETALPRARLQGEQARTAGDADMHAFLWIDGSLHDLNDLVDPADPLKPFVTLRSAGDINDRGQILADGSDNRSTGRRVYILTPVVADESVKLAALTDVNGTGSADVATLVAGLAGGSTVYVHDGGSGAAIGGVIGDVEHLLGKHGTRPAIQTRSRFTAASTRAPAPPSRGSSSRGPR